MTDSNIEKVPAKITNEAAEDDAPKDVTFASVVKTYAVKYCRGDVTKAGKAVRAKIRALGQDHVETAWPAFKATGKMISPPDGNRYPTAMPRAFAVELLTRKVVAIEEAEVIEGL